MPSELNGIYPDMGHLGPHELCEHPDIETTIDGGLYCSKCGKAFSHSEAVNEIDPPTSRFAYRAGETNYAYYCRLFPAYDPRD